MTSPVLMAHIIPFFPDEQKSIVIANTLLNEEVRYLEVQFAFSDPSADGPLIDGACQTALRQGFTVDRGFDFIRRLMTENPALKKNRAKIFLMTYASLLFARGIERFVHDAAMAGVYGLIVPDMPPDSDEGLREAAKIHSVHIVSVLAISSRPERIEIVQKENPEFIYCALRSGITGNKTDLREETICFLDAVGSYNAKILAGFGIMTRDQIDALTGHAHAAVVGSAYIRALQSSSTFVNENACVNTVRNLTRTLMGKVGS